MLSIYDVHKERGRGYHNILGNFADGCGWCFGRGIFLGLLTSTNPKRRSLSFHHKIFRSSIMETQVVRQPFMKVCLGKICFFFCQFYYNRLVNTVRFNEEKNYCISVLILLLMFCGKILIHHFLKIWRGGLCKSIAVQRDGQHCTVTGWVRMFDFSCGRHKWKTPKTLNWNNCQFFSLGSKTYWKN